MRIKLDRRLFVGGAAGLALAGCDRLASTPRGKEALNAGEALTYDAAKLLPPNQLAPEYPASQISKVFKPNGSIDPKDPAYKALVAAKFADWSMPVGGLVEAPRSFTLADLRAMPSRTQVTRHDCVEGWSCIGQWTGVPLSAVLALVKPKPEARYVVFHCYDRYGTDYTTEQAGALDEENNPPFYGSIGMGDAVQPQTILAYAMNGQDLPVEHGAPLRLRIERQLGYKNTKYIRSIELMDSYASLGDGKGGYWEDQGYEWYAGI